MASAKSPSPAAEQPNYTLITIYFIIAVTMLGMAGIMRPDVFKGRFDGKAGTVEMQKTISGQP